jgi:hypothetical protein
VDVVCVELLVEAQNLPEWILEKKPMIRLYKFVVNVFGCAKCTARFARMHAQTCVGLRVRWTLEPRCLNHKLDDMKSFCEIPGYQIS